MGSPPPVIFLMGPTAAGKTELALRLADALPADIVSVDSALVYRGMDIGTAKPTPDLRRRYPHRIVDVVEPEEAYSAARFAVDARREIDAIHAAGRIPLLVGGTFLYYRALEQGLTALPSADDEVRDALSREAAEKGWPALHRRLAEQDPKVAAAIHPNDAQRIQRALEVIALSGRGPSYWHERAGVSTNPWRIYRIALAPERREILHARIEQRFQSMMEAGFLDEVASLRARPGIKADLPSMRAVGYRQLWRYFEGECDLNEAVYRGIVATRQLAKRQMTWLRGQSVLTYLHETSASESLKALQAMADAGIRP